MILIRNLKNQHSFVSELENIICSVTICRTGLRLAVIDSPTFLQRFETEVVGLPSSKKELLVLAISSWYLPEEFQGVVQVAIEQKIRTRLDDFVEVHLCLKSKSEMILFLLDTKKYSERSFFGNILNGKTVSKVVQKLCWKRKSRPTKVKKPQRKRGYDDKGQLKPVHEWLPKSDYTLTQLQNEIEELKESKENSLKFIEGFIT